jgi:hypothetical protein
MNWDMMTGMTMEMSDDGMRMSMEGMSVEMSDGPDGGRLVIRMGATKIAASAAALVAMTLY